MNYLSTRKIHKNTNILMKCSHAFNLLDARGAISVSERVKYIARIRHLAQMVAKRYVELKTSTE